VTDNDRKVAALTQKYKDMSESRTSASFNDTDENYPTLEPQLLGQRAPGDRRKSWARPFASDDAALGVHEDNKTDIALRFFTTSEPWIVPGYVLSAIS